MKATGIVRRVDDLGRVVIPKEIRRTMKINEGEPLEIFLQDGMICFQKYENNVVSDMTVAIEKLEDAGQYDLAQRIREVMNEYKKQKQNE